jgi:hypothetical protein
LITANDITVKRTFDLAGAINTCRVSRWALVFADFFARQWASDLSRTVASLESCRGTGDRNDQSDRRNSRQT